MKLKVNSIIILLALLFIQLSCTKKKEVEKPKTEKITEQKKDIDYTSIGLEMAMSTQKVLGKNLKAAMKKGGPKHALKFCNTRAYPLTDSMSVALNAKIRRVTDKARNSANQANATELAHIQTFKDAIDKGNKVSPIIEKNNGTVRFYAPILTKKVCLKCHAPADKINGEVLMSIKDLYPNDAAIGYGLNQVRGIWSIEMDAKK